jgi:DNA-binding transcriptional LysR family regulator
MLERPIQFRDNQTNKFRTQDYADLAYPYVLIAMNLKQIEAFEAVATLGTTIAAAQRLQISQSVISRLIGQLEIDLGLRLFVREQGRLTLTREGAALVDEVRTLLDGSLCLQRHANQLRLGGTQRKLVRAMVPNTFAQHGMPAVMEKFYGAHEDAVLEVLCGTYDHGERALLSREVDVAFVRVPGTLPGLRVHRSILSQSACVIPVNHPLAAFDKIRPSDLANASLVLLGRQSQHRHEVDMAFRRARVTPRVLAEVHSVGLACAMVARGMGVTIVTQVLAACCASEGFVIRPFEPALPFEIGLATLNETSPKSISVALLDYIGDALTHPGS